MYGVRPSELVGIDEGFEALCFDEAVTVSYMNRRVQLQQQAEIRAANRERVMRLMGRRR